MRIKLKYPYGLDPVHCLTSHFSLIDFSVSLPDGWTVDDILFSLSISDPALIDVYPKFEEMKTEVINEWTLVEEFENED